MSVAGRVAFAGAVLTGGRSSRMGRDKALLAFEGVPLALRVASALDQAGGAPVVAVGGDGAALAELGLTWVPDRHPGEGPLGGLLTALAVLAAHELVAVVATDLPDLSAAVVGRLVDAVGGHDAAVGRTDRLEPLCAVWRSEAVLPVLSAAFEQGERAVHRALVGLDLVEVAVPERSLRNVNAPEDLAR
jgi:molybdenum cofactor guanylyltransferase